MLRTLPRAIAVTLIALLFCHPAYAQEPARGKVVGKLVAGDNGEPLGYADVALIPIEGKPIGTMTNADGTFTLEASAGVYTLTARAISYAPKSVAGVLVVAGTTKEVSLSLASDAIQQETVVVEGKAEAGTQAAMLNKRKKAASVGDVVSAEEVRKSPDRDAGDVLKRVTGTSLQDGKFVFVRGMGERYSSTEMDGVRIASPEQNKRVVPLDMIPSSLLENIVVQKTYTADRPGEFGGGDVQITTKDFPGKRMLQVSLALSCVGTLWVAHLGPGVAMLFGSLLLYSAFTSSRGTQTQAIVADVASNEDRDAAFSLYFLLGFLSQPFWVLVAGYLMDHAGFASALTVLSGTYIIGICVLFLMKDERYPRVVDGAHGTTPGGARHS